MTWLTTLKTHLWKAGLRHTRLWKSLKIIYQDRRLQCVLQEIEAARPAGKTVRVLVINHFFDGEIEAIRQAQHLFPQMDFVTLDPEPAFSRAITFFPEALSGADLPYDDPSLDAARARYHHYCETFYHRLQAIYPFDVILSPSDLFFWLREFIKVCQAHGKPTVVANKEGTLSPRSFESESAKTLELYPPVADHYWVWSERQRAYWLKTGLTDARTEVVGSMRTDLYVNLHKETPSRVVCFDFDADAYINVLDWNEIDWQGPRDWRYLRDAFHRTIFNLAREYPSVEFVIKCHPQQFDIAFPEIDFDKAPNIRLVRGAPKGLPALIAGAYAVVGFQTTALLEAALTNVPVIYGAWGELYDKVRSQILPWHDPEYGFYWSRSEEELSTAIRRCLQGEPLPATARNGLEYYFHQADGHVTERVLTMLTDLKQDLVKDSHA